MNKTIEQYSNLVSYSCSLSNQIIKDLLQIWNSNDENEQVSLFRLVKNDNGDMVTFSPNLNSPDGGKVLGYMQSLGYSKRIFLTEDLLSETVSFETLKEVVGHEFAHFIDSVVFGNLSHGATFKQICSIIGIDNDQASIKHSLNQVAENSNILEKIKKLLSLSESDNMNEAESALLKAKSLMREYGIAERKTDNEKIYRVALNEYNAFTAEINTLILIVRNVSNCWVLLSNNYDCGSRKKVVYAHGTKTECEIASYLYDYLQKELSNLYLKAKRENGLGRAAKKSWYIGVGNAMNNRFNKQQRETSSTELVSYNDMNKDLSHKLIYSETKISTKATSNYVANVNAYFSGKETGKDLKIRNGLNKTKSEVLQLN